MATVFCIQEFIDSFRPLSSNKRKECHKELIHHFFDHPPDDFASGTRLLNQPENRPYIKKRLGGKGGFRVYYLLLIHKNNVYLAYIHAKTGSGGADNLQPAAIKKHLKLLIDAIQSNNLFKVTPNASRTELEFKQVSPVHT